MIRSGFHPRMIVKPLGLTLAVTVSLLAILASNATAQDQLPKDTQSANQLIGMKAQDWQVKGWLNSSPVQLKDLLGKVVLVRWWTEGCPFCAASAPALNEFYDRFHSRGLEVIGFYHHKSDEPLDVERVYRYAKRLGFKFPVAIDYDWQTLRNWWLDNSETSWTSVSFLIDRRGMIRHIHPGGQYVQDDNEYRALKAKIEQLLLEK